MMKIGWFFVFLFINSKKVKHSYGRAAFFIQL